MIRLLPVLHRIGSCNIFYRASSASSTVAGVNISSEPLPHENKRTKKRNLVSNVFANLGVDQEKEKSANFDLNLVEKNLNAANDVESLLKLAALPGVSRKVALKILATLGDWTNENKISLSAFESDPRFLAMCRTLSSNASSPIFGDLTTILGVTGDDEAAKLISNASLSQMVRILSKLSTSKKRSPPLLRSLAFNISKSEERLSLKQCADILFAMVSLSFHDEVLLVKICSDASTALAAEMKPAVVGSIARSLGMLRCRDIPLLNHLTEWIVDNSSSARPQDVVAVLMALAIVDYQPTNADALWTWVASTLQPMNLPNSGVYLDAVWSLLLMDHVTNEQVSIVLAPSFIEKLQREDGAELSVSTSLKLLNIGAATQHLLKNYKGPELDTETLARKVPLNRSKDKTVLVNCVMDTLSNLLPGGNFLKRDIATNAGFIIDGECLVDSKCTPIPLGTAASNAHKIAIMVLGYHDTCVGARFQPNGVQEFARRILESQGYRVLTVLHSEFSPSSKLVQRVKYLEQKLKSLVTS